MSKLVCKSYFDAVDAEEDVETLIAWGQARSDITVIVSERGRRRYREESAPRGLRRGSIIAEAILGTPQRSTLHATLGEAGEPAVQLTVWGHLAACLTDRAGNDARGELLDLMLAAGVRRGAAEHLLADVFRGGVLIAVRVQDGKDRIVQCLLGYCPPRHDGFANQRLSA